MILACRGAKTVNYGGKNLGFGYGWFLQKTYVSVSVSDTITTLLVSVAIDVRLIDYIEL